MEILLGEFRVDKALLHYLPFMLDEVDDEAVKNFPPFENRQHFITIGNFLHKPNYSSVLHLKENIWPLIHKQLPKAELHVYGAYTAQRINELHNIKEGFIIKGFVDNVEEVMQHAKVCLAPLRFGAGLKGKLIDAMINGTPCVTTTVGAEGMYGKLEPNGFIEEDFKEFANMAVVLYKNIVLWKEKQHNGFKIINERFNKRRFQNKFISKLEDIKENLNNHRLNNFTGAMLQYHTMQSTKFMSRWIEEKNKTN